MNAQASFTSRLGLSQNFLIVCFLTGFLIALWNPHPRLILTVAVGLLAGMLILGPYSAVVLYTLGLQQFLGGHLRWPLCIFIVFSSVYLCNYLLGWKTTQFALASCSSLLGAILGHDATLAILGLRDTHSLDSRMVLVFPLITVLALLAGYSSFGFASGCYKFAEALLR